MRDNITVRYKSMLSLLMPHLREARELYMQPLIARSAAKELALRNYHILAMSCHKQDDEMPHREELVGRLLETVSSLNNCVIPCAELLTAWLQDESGGGMLACYLGGRG